MANQTGSAKLPSVELEKIAELEMGYGRRFAFSHDGRTWASADAKVVYLWQDLNLQQAVETLSEPTDQVQFSPNGTQLFVCPLIYNLKEQKWVELPSIREGLVAGLQPAPMPDQFAVYGGSWTPDGEELVVYTEYRPSRRSGLTTSYKGPEKRLLLLQGQTRQLIQVLWEGSDWEQYKTIAINDRYIVAAGVKIWVWERQSHQRVAELKLHTGGVRDLQFSPDGNLLVSVGADQQVILWDTTRWTSTVAWQGHQQEIGAVAFHPKLPFLATGGSDHQLKLWSLTGQLIMTQELPGPIEGMAFNPTADRLVVATQGSDAYLFVYNVRT